MNSKNTRGMHTLNEKNFIIIIHISCWLYVLLAPLLFLPHGETYSLGRYLYGINLPLISVVLFYINYYILVPKYFVNEKHLKFLLYNLMFFAILYGVHETTSRYISLIWEVGPPPHEKVIRPTATRIMMFCLRILFSYALTVALAITIRLSVYWHQLRDSVRQAELQHTESELKNLKSQINPHFLLNTLNNIYALVEFDSGRAKIAIEKLSRMLRHMLYDSQYEKIPLIREVQFLQCYIELMKLRIRPNVNVTYQHNIPEDCAIEIAPNIFISAVENAFKHGISPTLPSHINITFDLSENRIIFRVINSNFPKDTNDHQPGGIGLQQVMRRLQLIYPNSHTWNYGLNEEGNTYTSEITINI